MADRNYPFVIQKRIEQTPDFETWKTVSGLLDFDTANLFLAEIDTTPEGDYRIFFDAPDLMIINATCREVYHGHI